MSEVAEKRCPTCETAKPTAAFGRDSRTKDGLKYQCKACANEYGRRHYAKTSEQVLAKHRAKYAADPAKKQAANREWHRRNRERSRANAKAWREANPDYYTEYMRQRRALIAGTVVGPVDLAALWTGFCGICSERIDAELPHPEPMSKSVDHIIPIARGGGHIQENLQWAHLICNQRKSDRLTIVEGAA